MRKFVSRVLSFIMLFAAVTASLYVRSELHKPFPSAAASVIVDIPHGMGANDMLGLLETQKVIRNRYIALAYVAFKGYRHKLQAGEYRFDRPMTIAEVVSKIASGSVLLHKFTVPEGLTVEQTAEKWQIDGYGTTEEFTRAASAGVTLVQTWDPNAVNLEGYLFPETYSFPKGSTARQVVESMVNRFRTTMDRLTKEVPQSAWPLDFRDTVILASLVQSEAAHDDERPLVASVYLNRILAKSLLQCDPTVIYALQLDDRYRGSLTLTDLKYNSPYNTYLYRGLPPGPIASPGYPSLRAAIEPASTKYLYFVRTAEGRHTFSETLAAHERAVAAYRILQKKGR